MYLLALNVSYDGRYTICGYEKGEVKVWDLQTGKEALDLYGPHKSGVLSVIFTHDSKKIISGSYDRILEFGIWK